MNSSESTTNRYCVILAGGVGSRLWPYSRKNRPKQFLDLLGTGITLLQMTYRRFLKSFDADHIYVVTNERYTDLVLEQLPTLNPKYLLSEPIQRNTAISIAYSALHIHALDPNSVLFVAPCDHLIIREQDFMKSIDLALTEVEKEDTIITLGIKPTYAEPGYGYIQGVDPEEPGGDPVVGRFYSVKAFTEKPDRNMAKILVESGEFFWNAGFFVAKASFFITQLETYFPELTERINKRPEVWGTDAEMPFLDEVFPYLPSNSFDYAVMEKAKGVKMLLCDFGWIDLGSWNSLDNILKHDKYKNAYVGSSQTLFNECTGNLVFTDRDNLLVVLQGVSDLLVVEKDNVLVVTRKNDAQKLKQVMPSAEELDKGFVE